MRLLIQFLIALVSISCLAQKQDRIWVFGDHAGIDFGDTSNVISFYSGVDGLYAVYSFASISKSNGVLSFYVAADYLSLEGVNVYDTNNNLMTGGGNLAGHPAQTQCLLILPFPADTNRYYIIHKTQYNSKNNLFYSVVDMTLNGGLGAVINKNILIPSDSLTQRTTAVKHANGRDWWLIQQRWDQDEYIKFLITPDGIQGPFKQQTQNPYPKDEFYGTSYFSRSGNKLVSVSPKGTIDLMDFDRCTGDLSNYQRIGTNLFSAENSFLGCAFSANENVLYVSNSYPSPGKFVYQYDLTAPNITASRQIIMMYPDTGDLHYLSFGHMLLGADDKVYVCKGNANGINSNTIHTQNIDVILYPDVIGAGCGYQTNYFNLNGGRVTLGLPNMVNYSLAPVAGSVCDSLRTGILKHHGKQNQFTISPNPVSNWLNIYQTQANYGGKSYLIEIINAQGQIVLEKKMAIGDFSVPVFGLANGLYLLMIRTELGVFSGRFLKSE